MSGTAVAASSAAPPPMKCRRERSMRLPFRHRGAPRRAPRAFLLPRPGTPAYGAFDGVGGNTTLEAIAQMIVDQHELDRVAAQPGLERGEVSALHPRAAFDF